MTHRERPRDNLISVSIRDIPMVGGIGMGIYIYLPATYTHLPIYIYYLYMLTCLLLTAMLTIQQRSDMHKPRLPSPSSSSPPPFSSLLPSCIHQQAALLLVDNSTTCRYHMKFLVATILVSFHVLLLKCCQGGWIDPDTPRDAKQITSLGT